jgi:hypothetical protein
MLTLFHPSSMPVELNNEGNILCFCYIFLVCESKLEISSEFFFGYTIFMKYF